ncbi:MAG: hypothetical protein HQM13_09900 [SAR324 cluster bacterium]|nr:hypothetical protein [SAR324 cluster bacterium]
MLEYEGLTTTTTPLPAKKIGDEDDESMLNGKKVDSTLTFSTKTAVMKIWQLIKNIS